MDGWMGSCIVVGSKTEIVQYLLTATRWQDKGTLDSLESHDIIHELVWQQEVLLLVEEKMPPADKCELFASDCPVVSTKERKTAPACISHHSCGTMRIFSIGRWVIAACERVYVHVCVRLCSDIGVLLQISRDRRGNWLSNWFQNKGWGLCCFPLRIKNIDFNSMQLYHLHIDILNPWGTFTPLH